MLQKHTNNTREIAAARQSDRADYRDRESFSGPAQAPARRGWADPPLINFYVNEEDIRFLGNEKYSFSEGDEVLVDSVHRRRVKVTSNNPSYCVAQGVLRQESLYIFPGYNLAVNIRGSPGGRTP